MTLVFNVRRYWSQFLGQLKIRMFISLNPLYYLVKLTFCYFSWHLTFLKWPGSSCILSFSQSIHSWYVGETVTSHTSECMSRNHFDKWPYGYTETVKETQTKGRHGVATPGYCTEHLISTRVQAFYLFSWLTRSEVGPMSTVTENSEDSRTLIINWAHSRPVCGDIRQRSLSSPSQ